MSTTLQSTLSVQKLKPFGVKLTNVDLSSTEQCDRIRQLLYENGVIIIPADGGDRDAQPIQADESLLKLAGLFGQVENYHPVNESKNKVQILETMGDTGIPADSFLFHSDMSWRVNPSCASVLCGDILPESGGNTCFQRANQMYLNLSLELKEQLHSMSALHSLQRGYARVNRPDDVSQDIQSIHPAVIRHPQTGVPLLYLNKNFTVSLLGMSEQESEELLNRVFAEAYRPEQVLSHSWTTGDVVIWDNFGVQHLARADYEGLRRMHRVVAQDATLRTERYLGTTGSVNEAISNIEHYLKQDDNLSGYQEWALRYEQDVNQAGYKIPQMATDILAQHLGTDSKIAQPKILDVAAGTGKNALLLMKNHGLTNLEAIDVSTEMLFEARRRELYYKYHVENANQTLSLESAQYDALLCIGGLSASQIKAQPALAEFVRVTKDGGLVVLSMREAEDEYSTEVTRLVAEGLAEMVQEYSFIGIETNQDVRHRIVVLRSQSASAKLRSRSHEESKQAAQYQEARSPFGVSDILNFIRPGDLLLDAGCGTGQHARHLATVANQVVGIDIDPDRIAIAKQNCRDLNNTRFEVASIAKLPFEDNSFDVVLLAQVLHHLGGHDIDSAQTLQAQCQQAIAEAQRVLKTNGRLILVTTSREQRSKAYWHFNFFPQSAWERLDAVWSLTEDSWFNSLIEQMGFKAIAKVTPSESHWVSMQGDEMVRRSLDPDWRSTDVAFALLNPEELRQFLAQVKIALADGSAQNLIDQASAGRVSHGEASLSVFEK